MKNRLVCYALAGVLLTGTVFLTGCNETETEVVYEDLKVKTERPCMDTIVNYGDFMGTVSITDTVSVIPLVSGEITETYFEVGDYVNEGDVLFTIDDTQAKQNVASAKAAYAATKSSTDRIIGSALDQQTISATSGYKNAEIGLDTAQYNLSDLCSKIGDANSSISDLEKARDDIQNQINDLTVMMQTAAANPATQWQAAEYKNQIAAMQSQVASMGSSIQQLKSSRDQLQSTVHIYENQVKQAQVGMDIATVSLAETVTKVLNESVDSVNTTLNQAQVAVNNASAALKYYEVKSPVSGKIDSINVDKYGMAQAGAPSYVITTDETKKVTFQISEANINKLALGQKISAEYAGNEYTAEITDIAESVDPSSGLFKVEATFTGEQDNLYTGSSVKLSVETERVDNVRTLPLDAIYYENEQSYVYVNANGYAKKTYVTTGIYDSEKIQIIDGVDQDTEVITTWSARLKDGEKVNGVN